MFQSLSRWFFANAVLPIFIPVFCVALGIWFVQTGTEPKGFWNLVWETFLKFNVQGFYIFSALTLVFSLFEDYDKLKKSATFVDGLILAFLSCITMAVFYKQYHVPDYLISHFWKFFFVWAFLAIYAFKLKVGVLKYGKFKRLPISETISVKKILWP